MDLKQQVRDLLERRPDAGRGTIARELNIGEKKARLLIKELRRETKPPATFQPETARKILSRGPIPLPSLAAVLKLDPRETAAGLEEMRLNGSDIRELDGGQLYLNRSVAPEYREVLTPYYGNTFRFAIASDTHSASLEEKADELCQFYDLVAAEGIHDVLHPGDITAGYGVYPGQMHEVLPGHYSFDAQLARIVEHYPRRDGVTTRFITGNHDLSFVKQAGADIGAAVAYRRDDMQYVGQMAGRVTLGGILKVDLLHPDGGMPYARSYRGQKINEGYGRSQDTPHILIMGHLHTAEYLVYLGIHQFQAGCFEGQTLYLRRKGLHPEIGGWLVEVNVDTDGKTVWVNRLKPEWISFK